MSEDSGNFDYVIVGSGSAGAVIAARLSENPQTRVLLLEAGGADRNPLFRMPMGYAFLLSDPRYDWMFPGEPEPGMQGRSLMQHRGKVLGGTSSVNGMLYTRGVPADYDGWSQMGCAGWDWNGVLPYFRKAEDNSRGENHWHGVGGPLRVSDDRPRWELVDRFVRATAEAGYPQNPDLNGERQEGFGYHQYTSGQGRRWSTAKAYLEPARRRPNLRIETGALVTRILLDGRRAVGVEYRSAKGLMKATANAEVVVSAGSIGSPHLLQLSGVGPGALLRAHDVAVVLDLPMVGENLLDHFQTSVDFRCRQPVTLNDVSMSRWKQGWQVLQYLLLGSGMLAGNGIYAGGYVRTQPHLEFPDLALNFFVWSRDLDAKNQSALATHPFSGFSMSLVLQRPDSRGYVRLNNADPAAPPAIRYNFPGSQRDVDTLAEGVRIARRIAAQPALADFTLAEVVPGPEVESQDALRSDALARINSAYHVAGTCRMGPADRSVVDAGLKVHGIDGLRVADASIFPAMIAANTNAPAIMIGEKAADMISRSRR